MIRQMLNYPDFDQDKREPDFDKIGLPVGMVDYDLRQAMRNYFRVHGFEETREKTAALLDDLSGRRLS